MKSLIIAGPSGVGKGTIISYLIQKVPQLSLTLSYTTRPPRAQEKNGTHYYFINDLQFKKIKEQQGLLEDTFIFGNSYGTSAKHYLQLINNNKIPILDVDSQGVISLWRNLKKLGHFEQQVCCICILPATWKLLQQRLKNRKSQSEQSLKRRLLQNYEQCKKLVSISKEHKNMFCIRNYQYQLTAYGIRRFLQENYSVIKESQKKHKQELLKNL